MKSLGWAHPVVSLQIGVFALLAGWLTPAWAERTLSETEVKELFSGKTVEYYHERKKFDISAYYAPDGTVRGIRGGKNVEGEWSVRSSGELCIHRNWKNHCRIIVEEDGVYKKYKVKGDGRRIHVVTYKKFTDGNPNGY